MSPSLIARCLLPLLFATTAAAAPATVHSFFKVVQTAGPRAAGWQAIKKAPHPLDNGGRVRTGAGSWAEIRLEDQAKVRLEANADFSLPDSADGSTELRLAAGTVSAWVQKRAHREFRVRTPNATCSVRGTYFKVSYVDQVTRVELYEGVVAVADAKGHELSLKPNQKVEVGEQLGKPAELGADKAEKAGGGDQTDASAPRGDDAVAATQPGEDGLGGTAEWTANYDAQQLNELLRELDLDYRKEYVTSQKISYAKYEEQKLGVASVDSSGNRARTETFIAPGGGVVTISQAGGLVTTELRDAPHDTTNTTTPAPAPAPTPEPSPPPPPPPPPAEDADKGHGNDADRHDEDNPGQGNPNPPGLDHDRGHSENSDSGRGRSGDSDRGRDRSGDDDKGKSKN